MRMPWVLMLASLFGISALLPGQGNTPDGSKGIPYTIVVRTEAGLPAEGATVLLRSRGIPARGGGRSFYPNPGALDVRVEGRADVQGRCLLTLPYLGLFAVAEARQGDRVAIVDLPAEPGTIELTLLPTIDLRIRVQRPDGIPVRGVDFRLDVAELGREGRYLWFTTDTDGTVSCRLDNRASAAAEASVLPLVMTRGPRRRGEPFEAKRHEGPAGPLFVVEAAFGPDLEITWDAPGDATFFVKLWPVLIEGPHWWWFYTRTKTSRTSPVWFGDLEPGAWYYATVEERGGPPTACIIQIPPETGTPLLQRRVVEFTDSVTLRMRLAGPAGTDVLRFRLLDAFGSPLIGRSFEVVDAYLQMSWMPGNYDRGRMATLTDEFRNRSHEVTTDDLGTFAIPVWSDRPGELLVLWDGPRIPKAKDSIQEGLLARGVGSEEFLVGRPTSNGVIDVQTTLRSAARGQVVGEDGSPVPRASVSIVSCPDVGHPFLGMEWYGSFPTDEEGRFDILFPLHLEKVCLEAVSELGPPFRTGPPVPFRMGEAGLVLTLPR